MAGKEKGLFIVVSAPSGAGKTTICKEVLRTVPELSYSVSFTTRPMRDGEINGKDYFFVSEAEFRERIAADDFAEWTEKFGCLYGTSIQVMEESLSSGNDLLLDIDTEGAKNLKNRFSHGIFVFVLPPSLDALKTRLMGRGSETEGNMCIRLEKAKYEMKEIFWYDYVIINDDIQTAVNQLKSIYIAEKIKKDRVINNIISEFNLEE
jgi:guanylate kinase